jgi:molybdenum cofactor guanylyltransferase
MTAQRSIHRSSITVVILAGGQGARMGGADKGLQLFRGEPLAQHVLRRVQPQVQHVMISANRNIECYKKMSARVILDQPVQPNEAFTSPLAGFLTGLQHCETPYLLTVPCDAPLLPQDLVSRLAQALQNQGAQLAMALAPELNAKYQASPARRQPVFCLMQRSVLTSLQNFLQQGGRKIDAWAAQLRMSEVLFNDALAFSNINSLHDLQQLEHTALTHS